MTPLPNFPFLFETRALDDAARAEAEGDFVRLPLGVTHYEIGGPKDGAPVVLTHGFSVPYFIWDPTFDALTKAGFRVLRYDLYGRGYSDRPRARYDIHLFTRQLLDLLDALDFRDPVHLFGLSMGGPITASFAAEHPERIASLALFDPAGARQTPFPPAFKLLLIPGVGELILGFFGKETLLKGIARDFYDPAFLESFLEKYRPPMQFRGFGRAILSTMRNGMLGDFSDAYRKVGERISRVLLIWGVEDKTVPFDHSRAVLEAIPHAEFHPIEGGGHIPHYETPDIVNPILLKFLASGNE